MKNLTIMRHAKSSWDNPGTEDLARTLNERGRKAILLVGKYLMQHKIKPDLVLTSPAARALQTAVGISEQLGYKKDELKVIKDIYGGDTATLVRVIQHIDDKYDDVFLFGHEPILSSLIIKLTGKAIEKFPTCSAYRMFFDINKWSAIKPGSGICEFFVNPKLLGEK